MSERNAGVTADPVFLGVTRPAMRFGVTYMALIFNAVFTMEVFILTKNLLVLLIALPIHGVCMLLCARDARYFDLVLVWAKTRLVAYFCTIRFWKSASYSPLTLDLPTPAGQRRAAVTVRLSHEVLTATALRRELPSAVRIPYRAHVSQHVVRTESGNYVQVFKLAGASFESADDEVLNNWHERLNVLWRNIATANTALWVHVVRRRESPKAAPAENAGFAAQLAAKYRERLSSETLMANEVYLSVIYRPIAGAAPTFLSRDSSGKTTPRGFTRELADALDACEKLAQTIESSLARYEPERLAVYSQNERRYSAVLEIHFPSLVGCQSCARAVAHGAAA